MGISNNHYINKMFVRLSLSKPCHPCHPEFIEGLSKGYRRVIEGLSDIGFINIQPSSRLRRDQADRVFKDALMSFTRKLTDVSV